MAKLIFLVLLSSAISCSFGESLSTTPTPTFETTLKNDREKNSQSGPLDVELTSKGQIQDSNSIEFQLTNKGSEDIDLERMEFILELTEGKDATGQETKAGKLSPTYFSTSSIQAGNFNRLLAKQSILSSSYVCKS